MRRTTLPYTAFERADNFLSNERIHTLFPLQIAWSQALADPAVGFGGGQLGEVTQARVPPKLKTPRIWPTIFLGVAQNHVQK